MKDREIAKLAIKALASRGITGPEISVLKSVAAGKETLVFFRRYLKRVTALYRQDGLTDRAARADTVGVAIDRAEAENL